MAGKFVHMNLSHIKRFVLHLREKWPGWLIEKGWGGVTGMKKVKKI